MKYLNLENSVLTLAAVMVVLATSLALSGCGSEMAASGGGSGGGTSGTAASTGDSCGFSRVLKSGADSLSGNLDYHSCSNGGAAVAMRFYDDGKMFWHNVVYNKNPIDPCGYNVIGIPSGFPYQITNIVVNSAGEITSFDELNNNTNTSSTYTCSWVDI